MYGRFCDLFYFSTVAFALVLTRFLACLLGLCNCKQMQTIKKMTPTPSIFPRSSPYTHSSCTISGAVISCKLSTQAPTKLRTTGTFLRRPPVFALFVRSLIFAAENNSAARVAMDTCLLECRQSYIGKAVLVTVYLVRLVTAFIR